MMEYLLAIYTLGFMITVLIGLMLVIVPFEDEDTKWGARLLLTSPLWPLWLLYGSYLFLRWLIEEALE